MLHTKNGKAIEVFYLRGQIIIGKKTYLSAAVVAAKDVRGI